MTTSWEGYEEWTEGGLSYSTRSDMERLLVSFCVMGSAVTTVSISPLSYCTKDGRAQAGA